jgi:hypothetical protein
LEVSRSSRYPRVHIFSLEYLEAHARYSSGSGSPGFHHYSKNSSEKSSRNLYGNQTRFLMISFVLFCFCAVYKQLLQKCSLQLHANNLKPLLSQMLTFDHSEN